jgi:transposase
VANQLKMATIQSILSLHEKRWSYRRIARELGIDRETVSRYVRQAAQSASAEPSGSGWPDNSSPPKPANAPTGSEPGSGSLPGRQSDCEPWRDVILEKCEQGLSAKRIHQDLTGELGAEVSYDSVRRFLRKLGRTRPLPFRRMECQPGEEAQVDFGKGAAVLVNGKRRRPHLFRVVLSHSRKGYTEASWRQTTEDFLRCLENAFRHFGGCPKVLVIDNLRAAVKHPDWYDPELNPKLQSFCQHYGIVILPTRPYTPRHKGKVERGVGYAQDNALKGRVFDSLEAQNRHLAEWESTIADTRIHGTTKKQVGKVFGEVERPALEPLPRERFPFFHEAPRTVNRDGHVEVAKSYYSVPPEYLTRRVWVRWDARLVRVFNHRWEQIAVHVRQQPGRFSTQSPHIPSEKISGVERGAAWLLGKVRLIGPETARWAEAMLESRGVEGVRVLQGLISLATRHPSDALEEACRTAFSHRAFRLRVLRGLLRRREDSQRQLELLDAHPIIRPLADYTAFVSTALRRGAASPQGFRRHGSGVRGREEKGPGDVCRQGPGASSTRPRSGYPSSGCSPAEPDSVSPDTESLVPFAPRRPAL